LLRGSGISDEGPNSKEKTDCDFDVIADAVDLPLAPNKRDIIRELRRSAPIARVGLAKTTGISKPGITRVVNSLIAEGLVVEAGHGSSGKAGGKPSTLLTLNPAAYSGIGCVMRPGRITVGLAGFDGTTEVTSDLEYDVDLSANEIAGLMTSAIARIAESNPSQRPIVGLGIGVPGMVDREGRVFMTRLPGWRGFPLAATLANTFDVPVVVDNISRVQALAEGWFGLGRELRSYVCIDVSDGIAAGVVLRGALWRGERSLAGEIGHTHSRAGTRCHCGSDSCWENLASTRELLRNVRSALSAVGELRSHEPVTLDRVVQLLGERHAIVAEEVDAHANAVADGVSDIFLTYDPELVVIHGDSALLGDRFLEQVRHNVRQRFDRIDRFDPPIEYSHLGSEVALLGTISLVFRQWWGLDETLLN
jgi:predicted NBD/HSP70 family sugar kinase